MSRKKIKKEISQSERKKYLRTMMADLGVTSLRDLPSENARKSLLKATEPRPYVKKRLKDMGYDFSSNNNKKSLGTNYKSLTIKVAAASMDSAIDNAIRIRKIIGTPNYRRILKDIFPPKWKRSSTEQTYSQNILSKIDSNIYSENQLAIDKALQDVYSYLSDYHQKRSSPEELNDYLLDNKNVISKGHSFSGDVKLLQRKLEALGFLSAGYAAGVYGSETEAAVKKAQIAAGLPATGNVDYALYMKLKKSSLKASRQPEAGSKAGPEVEHQTPTLKSVEKGFGKDLSFLNFRNPGGLTGVKEETIKFLHILNSLAKEEGKKITITSLYRSSYDQARVMLKNYNARGAGSRRAANYLKKLYRRYPSVSEIIEIFASKKDQESKRKQAARVIKRTWPKVGHLSGKSVDIIPRDEKVREILRKSQSFAEVNILDEGNHFHATVKSLRPGGTTGVLNA
jgi:peptidoglycan hydrolase-like protein with peptidoglycan-binding domain